MYVSRDSDVVGAEPINYHLSSTSKTPEEIAAQSTIISG